MNLVKTLFIFSWMVLFVSCDDDDTTKKVYVSIGLEPVDEYAMTTDADGNIVEFDWMPKFDRVYTMYEITDLSFAQEESGLPVFDIFTYNGDGTVTVEGVDFEGIEFSYDVSVDQFENETLESLAIEEDGDYLFRICNTMDVYVESGHSLYANPSTCGIIDDLAAHTQQIYMERYSFGDTLGISYVQYRYQLKE